MQGRQPGGVSFLHSSNGTPPWLLGAAMVAAVLQSSQPGRRSRSESSLRSSSESGSRSGSLPGCRARTPMAAGTGTLLRMNRAEEKGSSCRAAKSEVPSQRNPIVVNVFRGVGVVGRKTEEVREVLEEVVVVKAGPKAAVVATADDVAAIAARAAYSWSRSSATRIESGLFL